MNAPRSTVVLALAGLLGMVLLGCNSNGSPDSASSPSSAAPISEKPSHIIALPGGVVAASAPQPNGFMWVLAGSSLSKNIRTLQLTGSVLGMAIPVSADARAIAQVANDDVVIGLATATTGALQVLSPSSGRLLRTIATGAPVRALATGSGSDTVFVLNGTSSSASVTEVDSATGATLDSLPVPVDTTAIALSPTEGTIFALQPSGRVAEVTTNGGALVSAFTTGQSGTAIAVSPDGATAYVLKDSGTATNVAVVNLATEAVIKALPAPLGALGISVASDGNPLYLLVNTLSGGNLQIFAP